MTVHCASTWAAPSHAADGAQHKTRRKTKHGQRTVAEESEIGKIIIPHTEFIPVVVSRCLPYHEFSHQFGTSK